MTKPLSQIITELMEMESKATQSSWKIMYGLIYHCPPPLRGFVEFSPTQDDIHLIAHSRNHLKVLLEALREAEETLQFYGELSNWNRTRTETGPISGHKYEIWEMDKGPHRAKEWIKKYSEEK